MSKIAVAPICDGLVLTVPGECVEDLKALLNTAGSACRGNAEYPGALSEEYRTKQNRLADAAADLLQRIQVTHRP